MGEFTTRYPDPSTPARSGRKPRRVVVERLPGDVKSGSYIVEQIELMADEIDSALAGEIDEEEARIYGGFDDFLIKFARKEARQLKKTELLRARRRQYQFEQMARDLQKSVPIRKKKKPAEDRIDIKRAESKGEPPIDGKLKRADVAVRFEVGPSTSSAASFSEAKGLQEYLLLENASLWWISNQSDDLLCLPYCKIQHLEYQIRTALRALGPLRGRALLSDEVGLGKTVEAGLVLKEYLTRGMVKRFLILTVPSLVDQWEGELSPKFNLRTVTTNQLAFRTDPKRFWTQNTAIIASLHTFKNDKHFAFAGTVQWDMLIVDEAHYLRNARTKAWKAVNATPRQYLLLLTATPVQNSLDDLYHLVTLLKPGQLPPPQEFRDRYIDKKHPHQPRQPDELRRLLGKVMIRNTRSNVDITLPPRRAETIIFEPDAEEVEFRREWENELRSSLDAMSDNRARFWGRLLLQTIGSSPHAWNHALESFPDPDKAESWKGRAPLKKSWERKLELLASMAGADHGIVVFSQYLATQAALAESLEQKGYRAWIINGKTPAADRQPITENFRREGGVLLLTHSGTEGRNLQFCHRMVNFDLPWNPMEIEQRIGRLHRIGQKKPVEVYNIVQAGTLQAHILDILQEKLNLFELVVGETGLILGDRFSSHDFAGEVLKRWRNSKGDPSASLAGLGEELLEARSRYGQIKALDASLFSDDYESL